MTDATPVTNDHTLWGSRDRSVPVSPDQSFQRSTTDCWNREQYQDGTFTQSSNEATSRGPGWSKPGGRLSVGIFKVELKFKFISLAWYLSDCYFGHSGDWCDRNLQTESCSGVIVVHQAQLSLTKRVLMRTENWLFKVNSILLQDFKLIAINQNWIAKQKMPNRSLLSNIHNRNKFSNRT